MSKWVKITVIVISVLIVIILALLPLASKIKESQLEKARDSVRIMDLKLIQIWIDQSYNDEWQFPSSLNSETLSYLPMIPEDPKKWETINWCTFWYTYEVFEKNWLQNNWYRLSTCLESEVNSNRLTSDRGIYDNKFEVWSFY